jgi:phosphatidylinositol glycan class M
VAVHAKLYPVIYTISLATAFCALDRQIEKPLRLARVPQFLISWIRRLLNPLSLLFGTTMIATFVLLTYLSVHFYGWEALDDGLLYHFARVDHRHNYSMHWYWIYLTRASGSVGPWVGRALLLPQAVVLLVISLDMAPHNLHLALFTQTFVFVAFNKVITAQYFTWYLCLLPLCSDSFSLTRRVKVGLALLFVSIGCWLGSAYCLEMQGWGVHRIVWIASMVFFCANVNLLSALLASEDSKRLFFKKTK